AAAAAQRRLHAHDWAHGRPVLVRIGMHTGHAVVVDEDYVGLDVHEAARVGAAGHGGQVLLTEATLAAAGDLDDDLATHDLGLHRLKDFPTPRRLLQLTGPGLHATFGPPRTTTARSHNLPRPPTPIVGRMRELEMVPRALIGDARLVTITGSGGLGKTRLSLEVSWSVLGWFREGVWFVDVSSLVDGAAIPVAVAGALGLAERAGVTPFDLLVEHFSGGPSLLVLDNLEQLLDDDAITVVSDLLGRCPDLTVLATSRERLRLRGEHEIALDGMGDADAVALFAARATAADPDFVATFEQVVKIVRAVDCIPLALELAAARVRTHDPDELLGALRRALDVLTEGDRDLPTRHRTMRAAVAWSWDLCDDDERDVLRALAVFAGDADRSAVDAVHGRPASPLLDRLADRSMVVRRGDRIGVLVPIRAFVAEQLGDAARAELEGAHGLLYAGRAAAATPHLVSSSAARWLDRLDVDALDLLVATERLPAPEALAVAGALVRWWVLRSRWFEGCEVSTACLPASRPTPPLTRSLRTPRPSPGRSRGRRSWPSSRAVSTMQHPSSAEPPASPRRGPSRPGWPTCKARSPETVVSSTELTRPTNDLDRWQRRPGTTGSSPSTFSMPAQPPTSAPAWR
ncbi:MAG: hypothetical protein M3Q68_03860, partial [Actinomycetota bacterium]|nr:hypothetical protein [Actinomycetota bacterium]